MKEKFIRYLLVGLLACLAPCSGTLVAQERLEVTEASIRDLQQALESGRTTSVQLVEAYLDRIRNYDREGPRLNSIVRVNPAASAIASGLDEERRRGAVRGPLHGIPVILKDNYNTDDMPTTGGSVALAGFVPNADAAQVERLEQAGAIILAKSNLHEFAYGITSVSSLVGQTRNPYDPRRIPGGSSGGTAAAIAASFAAIGMGTDTCGSIRIPAAFNNLVGLRPSKGLSSIYGIMPLSHTQDVGGPLARTVTDLALVLDAVAGHDPRDPATDFMADRPPTTFVTTLNNESLEGLRIGRLADYFEQADPRVVRTIDRRLSELEAAGVEIIPVESSGFAALIASSGLIGHEFRTDLNAYLAEFGSNDIESLASVVENGLYHQIVAGTLSRSSGRDVDENAYRAAYARRAELRAAVEQVLSEQNLDALVYPPIAELPVFAGESQPGNNCSLSANSGLPAIVFPAGFTGDGLPVGLELLGRFMSDERLVSIAYQVEQLGDFRIPPSTTPPLVNGRLPAPLYATVVFSDAEIAATGLLRFMQATGEISYSFLNESVSQDSIYAITLQVDDAPLEEFSDPQLYNLMAPDRPESQGEFFASPDMRQAIAENRLYVRIFGDELPVEGSAVRVEFE